MVHAAAPHRTSQSDTYTTHRWHDSPLGLHTASSALELGGAHAAPEPPQPEAIGHSINAEVSGQ